MAFSHANIVLWLFSLFYFFLPSVNQHSQSVFILWYFHLLAHVTLPLGEISEFNVLVFFFLTSLDFAVFDK